MIRGAGGGARDLGGASCPIAFQLGMVAFAGAAGPLTRREPGRVRRRRGRPFVRRARRQALASAQAHRAMGDPVRARSRCRRRYRRSGEDWEAPRCPRRQLIDDIRFRTPGRFPVARRAAVRYLADDLRPGLRLAASGQLGGDPVRLCRRWAMTAGRSGAPARRRYPTGARGPGRAAGRRVDRSSVGGPPNSTGPPGLAGW